MNSAGLNYCWHCRRERYVKTSDNTYATTEYKKTILPENKQYSYTYSRPENEIETIPIKPNPPHTTIKENEKTVQINQTEKEDTQRFIADEILKLWELYEKGILTNEEFKILKESIVAKQKIEVKENPTNLNSISVPIEATETTISGNENMGNDETKLNSNHNSTINTNSDIDNGAMIDCDECKFRCSLNYAKLIQKCPECGTSLI